MNPLKSVLKVRKKGVVILPKKLREEAGIKEGDEVIAEASEGMIVLKPLKPKVVDVDPELIEEFLREEYGLEGRKCGNILEA